MANFEIAYIPAMKNEGGLANDPKDKGKLTYMGIASAYWPDWSGWAYVHKAMLGHTTEQANRILGSDQKVQALVKQFYKVNFWDVFSLDNVNSQSIANELFDTGLNMGVGVEGRFLQRAINVTGATQLVVDGAIGAKTINAINAHSRPDLILKILNILQGNRYIEIAERDSTQERFMNSWLSRVSL